MPWAHQHPSKGSFDTTTQLSISCQHILLPQAQHTAAPGRSVSAAGPCTNGTADHKPCELAQVKLSLLSARPLIVPPRTGEGFHSLQGHPKSSASTSRQRFRGCFLLAGMLVSSASRCNHSEGTEMQFLFYSPFGCF